MNQDQIIEWAGEADEYTNGQTDDPFDYKRIYDEYFARLIQAAALGEAADTIRENGIQGVPVQVSDVVVGYLRKKAASIHSTGDSLCPR